MTLRRRVFGLAAWMLCTACGVEDVLLSEPDANEERRGGMDNDVDAGGLSDASLAPSDDAAEGSATMAGDATFALDAIDFGREGGGALDATTDVGLGGPSCAAIPQGWSPVLFNGALDPCPAGFSENLVFGAPTVGTGACTCTCSVTQPGGCGQASLSLSGAPGHGVDTCVNSWFTTPVSGSQCIAVPAASQTAFEAYQAAPVTQSPQGGACTSAIQTNPAALSEPTQRFCDVPASSTDAGCFSVPAGFSACIVAPGTVSCPPSTPFVRPFTVEDAVTLSCGSCSSCSVATSCSTPTLAVFTNATCTAPALLTFPANGTCTSVGNEVTALSVQYTAASNVTCTAGSSSATVQLTGARTICCQ